MFEYTFSNILLNNYAKNCTNINFENNGLTAKRKLETLQGNKTGGGKRKINSMSMKKNSSTKLDDNKKKTLGQLPIKETAVKNLKN